MEPMRAHVQGLNAEQADQVDDWSGRYARAAMTTAPAVLPELAADDGDAEGDREGFNAETMSGEVAAFPAVMGRPYRMGFVTWHELMPGAFDDSIADQDGRIPLYVQHSWDWSERPPIGHTWEIGERDLSDDDGDTRAIHIAGRLYPDVPDGLAVLHGLAARALREWSIGYLIDEYSVVEDEDNARTVLRISRAQLWEASVVLRGANPWTRTEHVASNGSTRVQRAARLLGVDAQRLEAAMSSLTATQDTPPAPDPELVRRAAELELRAAAPTFSRYAHRR